MIRYYSEMVKSEKIDEILQQISGLLPQDLRQTSADVRKNLKAGVSASLARMDLVTRQEFEIQSELLARSRALLEQLELRVSELEAERRQDKDNANKA